MAKKPTAAKAVQAPAVNMDELGKVVAATVNNGFVYLDSSVFAPMVNAGLVETNKELVNEAGHFATRATAKGIELMSANSATASAPVEPKPVAVAGAYVIRSDVTQPPRTRSGAGRVTTLPFDLLQPGQSFHVPVSEARPDPVKSLSPSVSSYNAKYSEETGEMETIETILYAKDADGKRVKVDGHFVKNGTETVTRSKRKQLRVFSISPAAKDDPDGPGARIFRRS